MPVVPCDVRRFAARVADQFFAFAPERGSLSFHGRRPDVDDGRFAALITVAIDDPAALVASVSEQAFVTQRGTVTRGSDVSEATRLILFARPTEAAELFCERVIAIAERLLGTMQLVEAVVEVQARGRRTNVLAVVR